MPSVVSNDNSVGVLPWSDITKLQKENWQSTTYAYVDGIETPGYKESNYIYGRTFNFNVPTNAVITGIAFSIETSVAWRNVWRDFRVYLVKGGTISGNNKATLVYFGAGKETRNYGGSADLWGTTWTPANINDSNFGFKFSAEIIPDDNSQLRVFKTMLTVYYSVTTGSYLTITIKPSGSETIDGQAQIAFDTSARKAYHLMSNGTNWLLLGVF